MNTSLGLVLIVLLLLISSSSGDSSSTTLSSDEYYDDEDYANQAQSVDGAVADNQAQTTTSSPYQCPLQCRCWFNKPASSNTLVLGSNGESNDYYEDDETENETKRSRRSSFYKRAGSNSRSNNTDYDDEYDSASEQKQKDTDHHHKYDITVDCTGQGLSSISNLFDYDFPLEQIVSLNLSYNNFRLLRLDDGFEDLISLQELDLSANHQLKSLSPRNFLRKFRHLKKIYLNNINQINCQSMNEQIGKTSSVLDASSSSSTKDWSILSKSMPIDCRWYKTLLYLYRRNTTIVIDRPAKCNLDQYLSTNTISLLLMSKCFSSELLLVESNNEVNNKDAKLNKDSSSTSSSTSRLVEIDANNKYDFSVEPSINQMLVEGDSLELTCRLKKLNTNQNLNTNFQRLKMNLFYKSQIKWYVNETQLQQQVQVVENKAKLKNSDFLIESKLIVAKTSQMYHSGRFYCAANLYVDNARHSNRINTSSVEIKIVGKFDLDSNDKSTTSRVVTTTPPPIYCPEMIIQTYKGVYKWPKTVANSRYTQSCSHSLPYSNSSSHHVYLDCLPSGEWSHRISADLQCQFESNLTKYLDMLNSNLINSRALASTTSTSRLVSLEDFIHDVVKIQTTNQTEMNMYDIVFIQNYLNQVKLQLQRLSTQGSSEAWRYQLLLINDMFAKLNSYYFDQARRIAPKTFSRYFTNTLLDTILTSQSNTTLSTSLAFVEMNNQSDCWLNKYQLTQQLYFQCSGANSGNTSRVRVVSGDKVQVILFDTDKLFPYVSLNASSLNYSNYDKYDVMTMEQLADVYINEMGNTIHKSRPSGQVYVVRAISKPALLNLTLELKLPTRLVQTIELLQAKNLSKTNTTHTLFDQVFGASESMLKSHRLRTLRDQLVKFNQTEDSLVVVNSNLLLNDEPYYLSLVQHATRAIQEYVLASPKHFHQFRQLVNKWFGQNMYQVVYGRVNNLTIEWTDQIDSNDIKCELVGLDRTPSLALYAKLSCHVANTSSPLFISVRHKSSSFSLSTAPNDSMLQMIDKFGSVNNLIATITDWPSFKANYTVFRYKIIYFFTILGLVLLLTQSIVYMTYRSRLLMPRSMFHSLLNKWLCLFATISIYLLGIQQTRLPQLCFLTSLLSLFFLLATFIWYLLTFYSFFVKLNRLKKRNFNLIFNKTGDEMKKEDDDDDINEDIYVPKPVVYLYMLGYGVPLLFCSVVVSIVKRDFVQSPYSYCFTNNVYVLAGALLAPVLVTLLVVVVLIVLVLVVLRRIINDLKYDDEKCDMSEKEQEEKLDTSGEKINTEDPINTDDKVGMWRDVDYYDMKNENQMLQVQQNRIVKPVSPGKKKRDDDDDERHETSTTSSTSTFFDKRRQSSIQSDQTSIMDAQHTPGVQLKYSVFSLLLFILICVQASLLMTFNTMNSNSVDIQSQLVAYSLAILVFILCVSEISFYVLSREDLMLCRGSCLIVFMSKGKYTDETGTQNSPSSSYRNYSDQNNLYFEPKPLLADHKAEEQPQRNSTSQSPKSSDQEKRSSRGSEDSNQDYQEHKKSIETSTTDKTHRHSPITTESTSDAVLNSSNSSSSSSSAFSSSEKKDIPMQKVSLAAEEETGSGSEYHYQYNYVYGTHNKPPPVPSTATSSNSGIALRKQTSSSTNINSRNTHRPTAPSTTSEQTNLTNDSSYSLNTSHNSGKKLLPSHVKKPTNPIYSDYNHYEEDNTIYQRLVTTNAATRMTNSKIKLNELLNQKCASHAGTAIEMSRQFVPDMLLNSATAATRIVRDVLKSGSGTSHAVDSVISDSVDSVSSMNSKDLMPPPALPPIAASHHSITKISSESSNNLWQSSSSSSSATSSSTEYVYARLPGSASSQKVQTLIDSKLIKSSPGAHNNTLSRNSIFKPKEVEAKHETSV